MDSISYHAPDSLQAAVSLLKENEGSFVLAGGTDLLVQMRLGIRKPQCIVDIKAIPGIKDVELSDHGLHLGSAAPCQSITEREDVEAVFPGLVEAADLIGSTQIQGRCSIGGNLCNSGPAADTTASLIVNNAICNIAGPNGERQIAAEDFNTGPGQNCLVDGEFLVSLSLPAPVARTSDAYLRFIPRTEMDIAVVASAVSVTLDSDGRCTAARVAIAAVGPTHLMVPDAANALIGTKIDDAALEAAANAASATARPISDKRGTADFRRTVVGVMTKRAAAMARDRVINAT